MKLTMDDLYTVIGELYVRTQVLEAKVKELMPLPDEGETELNYGDIARISGAA